METSLPIVKTDRADSIYKYILEECYDLVIDGGRTRYNNKVDEDASIGNAKFLLRTRITNWINIQYKGVTDMRYVRNCIVYHVWCIYGKPDRVDIVVDSIYKYILKNYYNHVIEGPRSRHNNKDDERKSIDGAGSFLKEGIKECIETQYKNITNINHIRCGVVYHVLRKYGIYDMSIRRVHFS